MSKLLLDQDPDNEPASILERNGLTSNEELDTPIEELEKTFRESTSDLPLNKALHLLLHVHGHVFDKAVASLNESSTPAELLIKKTESPTLLALVSVDSYLDQQKFQHIYDPLKDKFLKRVPSEPAMRIIGYLVLNSRSHQQETQQYLINQLNMQSDKRSQLAAVVLLQFLFSQYISRCSNSKVCRVFIDALMDVISSRSSSPTLLSCSACTLALQMLQHIVTHPETDSKAEAGEDTMKIIEIMDSQPSQPPALEANVQNNINRLLDVLEKWHTPKDSLIVITYQHLRQQTIHGDDVVFFKYLTPTSVLSPKPLSIKRQKQLLSTSSSHSIVLMLWVLFEKGQFSTSQRTIMSVEEEQILEQVYSIFESVSSDYTGDEWMPQFVISFPQSSTRINNVQLVESVLDRCCSMDDLPWIVPMVMRLQDKESCICRLIWYLLSDETKKQFAFAVLSQSIQQGSQEIILLLQDNLLRIVKQSNQACELLIQCMPHLRLPLLIQRIMKMVINASDIEKEKITCIALISKALLQETWVDNSILLYIDLIREFKALKGFVHTIPPSTPQHIIRLETSIDKLSSENELETQCIWLMGPIQLWATKVESHQLISALRQLVRYTYGLPQDSTCIDAWRHLAIAFDKDHTLIWPVVEECLAIMQTQSRFNDELMDISFEKEILLFKLSPMLILQTIPKEAFNVVELPKSFIDLISSKLQSIGIEAHQLKMNSSNNNRRQISIHLAQELLQRCFEKKDEIPIDFTISLLTKIFCK